MAVGRAVEPREDGKKRRGMRSGPAGTSASASYAGVACDKTHLSHVTRSDINPTGAERPERKLIATLEVRIPPQELSERHTL